MNIRERTRTSTWGPPKSLVHGGAPHDNRRVGQLTRREGGTKFTLTARTLIGRVRHVTLWLDRPHVSSEHAIIHWSGNAWELKDLGSRNGTFVDGKRIDPGVAVALKIGSVIGFGGPMEEWTVDDVSPPVLNALDLERDTFHEAENGLLSLPPEGPPELSIYQDQLGRWVGETAEGDAEPVSDLSVVTAGGRSFRLSLPEADQGTPLVGLPSLEVMTLRFDVPRNQEHIQLTLVYPGGELELEPREHAYLLLLLAEARIDDAETPESDRGWVDRDELAKMVGVSVPVLHVLVHRARVQFAEHGIPSAAAVIGVRRGGRRLGMERVEIVRH